MRHTILLLTILFLGLFSCSIALADNQISVPVLVYHNFDPIKKGSMTISTQKFATQMQWLKSNGYTVIPLMTLVNYSKGKINALPPKSVVITADDGRESVYQYMFPIVRKYNIPVTLFIYPMVISHAAYALTWEQLKDLQKTGLFDVQGHTYWHPNFKQEKKHLSESAYQKMVYAQLVTSKKILEQKLGTKITLLAWPFGIHDTYLENEAAKAGYIAAFSIAARHDCRAEKMMAQPRYMMVEDQSMAMFEAIVKGRAQGKRQKTC